MDHFVLSIFVQLLIGYGAYAATFNVRVAVPKDVSTGSSATLSCLFAHDTKAIHSVTWYRGSREFLRVVNLPAEQPSIQTFDFPVGKLPTNIAAPNITQVTLKNVSSALSGQYTCEVTVLPSMATVSGKEMLYIYDPIYLGKPSIRTEEYSLDESTKSINVLCGFDASRDIVVPVEKIPFVFYVNQQKIDPTFTVYDDYSGFLILNTSLLRWKDRSEKRISCSANLPGTSGLRSDELLINASKRPTADAIRQSCTIVVVVSMMFVLTKWCS